MIYNHLTVRLPAKDGEKDRFLINPYGLLFSEVTAASLIAVDIEGNIVDQGTTKYSINKAGTALFSLVSLWSLWSLWSLSHFIGRLCYSLSGA